MIEIKLSIIYINKTNLTKAELYKLKSIPCIVDLECFRASYVWRERSIPCIVDLECFRASYVWREREFAETVTLYFLT